MVDEKLREYFGGMTVYKDLKKSNFFLSLGLPSFLRDWLIRQFSDEEGNLDFDGLKGYMSKYLPSKKEWMSIKDRIIHEGEPVKILTRISVDISVRTGEISFELPDFGLTYSETTIESAVWDKYREDLVSGQEVWGIIELGYRYPDDNARPKVPGKIKLLSFVNFCPYKIDLEYYKDVRKEFTTSEWIDALLAAIDYNPDGYENDNQKLTMLTRLLPFVEKKLNLIELAPKGTGKSYVFGHVSKYGLLADGGRVTRAKMFYDVSRKMPGFITGHDYIAIDEVKLVEFGDANEIRSILQGYMEYGQCNVSGYEVKSDAGIVFLGNIDQDNMRVYRNMFSELPPLFKESALVDRIHGFIKGWDIPRMNDDLKFSGWALNSEYLCSIMHELRDDISYRAIVDSLVNIPEKADTRDTEAVKRMATGYLKLLFPNVREAGDVDLAEFKKYCLEPAMGMRQVIREQLAILDKEYRGKNVPDFTIKGLDDD